MDVYPLIFSPLYKPKIWGGQRLASLLHKDLPPDQAIGESWEIADLEDDQSVVARGPVAGKTLRELTTLWGADLLGRTPLVESRFPFLIKFLDAQDTLSVQVHPDEAMAKKMGGQVRVKNEAWYVVDTIPDGFIYRGVREGVTAKAFRQAIDQGSVKSLLNRIPVRKGHCYYLPSGTVHALGAGVVVAEVQTPSDVTYRVHDFDRIDETTGHPRALHIEQAMACIRFDGTPIAGEEKQHLASVWTSITSLVRCESFVIERVRMVDGVEQPIPYQEMVIWIVLEGHGTIRCRGLAEPFAFRAGDTVLLPAGMKESHVAIHENSMWLEVSAPIKSALEGYDRPSAEALRQPGHAASGLVELTTPDRDKPTK